MTYALIGNPNSGKTTLFNALTGENQYVGNWPGVTVERREGAIRQSGARLVDLPGVYSLEPYSIEEKIARDYLINSRPDAVINVVDATTIERGLYLTTQLIDSGLYVVVALNMIDALDKRGVKCDCARLSRELRAPVAPISAREKRGLDELLAKINPPTRRPAPNITAPIDDAAHIANTAPRRPAPNITAPIDDAANIANAAARRSAPKIAAPSDDAAYIANAAARYDRIARIAAAAGFERRERVSEKIDAVLIGKYAAYPAFFAMLALMFYATFGHIGARLSGLMESVISLAGAGANRLLASSPAWTKSLAIDGVLAGVGGVLAFLPQILLLFLFISVLEDSGYMARAAYLADMPLKRLGLSGRSFIPMLMGYGCTTTAVIAARGVENQRDRRMTIMLTPYMSCAAKLPIYALFTAAFLPSVGVLGALLLYALGAVVMAVMGAIMRKIAFSGGVTPFIMELPEYRFPVFSGVMRRLRDRARDFLTRAGSIIFVMSVVMWFLTYFTPRFSVASDISSSIMGAVGSVIAPVFRPLGFGSAGKCVALLTGIVAKEAVVSTMRVIYASDSASLVPAVRGAFTPDSAAAFIVFTLLYTPCVSALSAMRRELGSRKLFWFSIISQLIAAYLCALLARLAFLLIC